METIRIILRDPVLRMVAGLMFLQGALTCSLAPSISVLAMRTFGLGNGGYAALMIVSTVVSVTSALYSGTGATTFSPSAISFVLAHALLLPANTMFGQLFAQARLAADTFVPKTSLCGRSWLRLASRFGRAG